METDLIKNFFTSKVTAKKETQNIEIAEIIRPVINGSILKPIEIETLEAEEIPYNPFLWDIEQKPIYTKHGEIIQGYQSIIRDDNHEVLNVCKDSYTPTKNDVLVATALQISQISGLDIYSFNELKNGAVVSVWLKSTEPLIINNHEYHNYMIVGNSHNSQHAFFIGSYTSMVRCDNQFAKVHANLKAYHTSNNLENIKQIVRLQSAYESINQEIRSFLVQAESIKLSDRDMQKYALNLFNITDEKKKSRNLENFNQSLLRETKDLGMNGLGFFQAVTHFTTHIRTSKDKVYSNIFGSNANLIQKTINLILN